MSWQQICPRGHVWPKRNRWKSCPWRHKPYAKRTSPLQAATTAEQLTADRICRSLGVRRVKVLRGRSSGGTYWDGENRLITDPTLETLYHELAHHITYCRGYQDYHGKPFLRSLKSVLRVASMPIEQYKISAHYQIEKGM